MTFKVVITLRKQEEGRYYWFRMENIWFADKIFLKCSTSHQLKVRLVTVVKKNCNYMETWLLTQKYSTFRKFKCFRIKKLTLKSLYFCYYFFVHVRFSSKCLPKKVHNIPFLFNMTSC